VEHFTNDDTTAQDYTRMKHIPKYESTSEIYIAAYYSLGTLNYTFEIFLILHLVKKTTDTIITYSIKLSALKSVTKIT